MATHTIALGADIAAAIAGGSAGDTYTFAAGVHRARSFTYSGFTVRAGDIYQGVPGAIISGAVVVTGWASMPLTGGLLSTVWYVTGVTDDIGSAGECEPGYRCDRAEDVYFDGEILRHATSLATMDARAFYYDYTAHRVYVGTNPAGHTVEQCRAAWFTEPSTVADVVIQDLIFERFANPAQTGVFRAKESDGWIIRRNEFRENHGYGVGIGPRMLVSANYFHHMGQMGLGGGPGSIDLEDVIIEDNEIAHNNTNGTTWGWEGGGCKFSSTFRLIVRRNWSHHNLGPGLWTDIDNIDTEYDSNIVEDNFAVGIYHEISGAARIHHNTLRRNGFGSSTYAFGAAIAVSASNDVEVDHNWLDGNADGIVGIAQPRGSGAFGPHVLVNLWVHHNTTGVPNYTDPSDGNSPWSGVVQTVGDPTIYDNSSYESNAYFVSISGRYFTWADVGNVSFADWQALYGQDLDGSFTVGTAPDAPEGGTSISAPVASVAVLVTSPLTHRLTWVQSGEFTGTYSIYRCAGVGCTSFDTVTTGRSYLDPKTLDFTDVVAGTTYRYRIVAVQDAETAESAIVTTGTIPTGGSAACSGSDVPPGDTSPGDTTPEDTSIPLPPWVRQCLVGGTVPTAADVVDSESWA